jgi:hypothetical protein
MKQAEATTIGDLFGRDKIEDAKSIARTYPRYSSFGGLTAQIIMPNGNRRFFRSKSLDHKTAIKEVLTFVNAVEELTGERVMWKLKGENTYHLSTNFTGPVSLPQRISTSFQKVLKYFFDI